MNRPLESSLPDQRLALRAKLQAQRKTFALQLASDDRSRFPRSITMRLFLDRPELLARLVSRIAGARLAGRFQSLLIVMHVVHSFAALGPRPSTPVE